MIECLNEAGNSLFTAHDKPTFKVRPGWSEYVADLHDSARQCLSLWREAGKPRQGYVFDLMTRSRARFKYALRNIKRRESQLRSDKLAELFAEKSPDKFWKEIRKINCAKSSLLSSINGISGNDDIVNMWKQHYDDLFNCIRGSSSKKCGL